MKYGWDKKITWNALSVFACFVALCFSIASGNGMHVLAFATAFLASFDAYATERRIVEIDEMIAALENFEFEEKKSGDN